MQSKNSINTMSLYIVTVLKCCLSVSQVEGATETLSEPVAAEVEGATETEVDCASEPVAAEV